MPDKIVQLTHTSFNVPLAYCGYLDEKADSVFLSPSKEPYPYTAAELALALVGGTFTDLPPIVDGRLESWLYDANRFMADAGFWCIVHDGRKSPFLFPADTQYKVLVPDEKITAADAYLEDAPILVETPENTFVGYLHPTGYGHGGITRDSCPLMLSSLGAIGYSLFSPLKPFYQIMELPRNKEVRKLISNS
ncbi:MAG: hypothetical protein HGA85_07840 [Nanoarchaeota archaeon]|nr:hypothetical protein [Nanoarchaeota archaeon]